MIPRTVESIQTHRHSFLPKDKFSEDVEVLWRLRRQKDFESSQIAQKELEEKWFCPPETPSNLSSLSLVLAKENFRVKDIVALLSFECANLRTQGKLAESDNKLNLLREFLIKIGSFNYFHYQIELCQRELEAGNFHQSLLHASKMLEFSTSTTESLTALIHKLLCLENMGFDTTETELEIDQLTRNLKSKLAVPLVIRQQWTAYLARKYFRQGDLTRYLALKSETPAGQESFHMAFVYQLPYSWHYPVGALKDESIEFALNNMRTYPLNTLLGIEDSQQNHPAKLIDRCDRLYLWTWRWITRTQNPRQTAYQVLLTLREALDTTKSEDLTIEDRFFLTNSMLWIAFFSPERRAKLMSLVDRLRPQVSAGFELFELEYNLISYFIAQDCSNTKNSNLHKSAILNSPIKDSPFHYLFKSSPQDHQSEVPELTNLRNEIAKTLDSKTSCLGYPDYSTVDIRSGAICILDKRVTNSALLARAIRSLYWCHGKSLRLETFYQQVFSKDHALAGNLRSRTHTILSQISGLFDKGVTFHLRDNLITQEGTWPKVFFIECSQLTEELSEAPPIEKESSHSEKSEKTPTEPSSVRSLVIAVQTKPGSSRAELQSMMKIPKTSLRRFIMMALTGKSILEKMDRGRFRYYPTQRQ